jgi:hypothetical protein
MRQAAVMFDEFGQTEVRHVRAAVTIEQDISRLEIAVQNATLMGVMNRARNRGEQTSGFALCVAAGVRRLTIDFCFPLSAFRP